MMRSKTVWCVACLAFFTFMAFDGRAEDARVEKTAHARLAAGPLHAYVGSVALPADGLWTIRSPQSADSISELYLLPTQPARLRQLGTRMYAALEEQQVQAGRWQVQMGFEACRQYAQEHEGEGPGSIGDFQDDNRWEYLVARWDRDNWRNKELLEFIDEKQAEGPFVYLVPKVRFEFEPPPSLPTTRRTNTRKIVSEANRKVLAFELRPLVDDGRHWVLFTDGSCERIDIDPELLKQHNVSIRPIISKRDHVQAKQPTLDYQIVMVAAEVPTAALKLEAYNQVLDATLPISWNVASAAVSSDPSILQSVQAARQSAWKPYLMAGSGGVLDVWDRSGQPPQPAPDANPRQNLSMFSVLGGRAAVEETLQLQNLAVVASQESETVDVDSIQGVEVKSHPFEEMLEGQPGGQLEMARYVPADRFFLYVGKPESISALLDTGAPFIASMGTSLTGNCLHYNLESRYLARLGMTRDWVDAVLASGLTSEMAIFTPDLFFIDGTDMTVVAKLRSPQLLRQMLGMLGASDLTTKSVLELPTGDEESAFLALRDDLLFISTQRSELEDSLRLLDQEGVGSLGDSAEFRYMLSQLPVQEETRIYAYFSDPFVRRLVGPRVKIGQRRRVLAKAKMEALTAQAMMAKLNGQPIGDSLETMIGRGEVPGGWQDSGLSIDSTGLVSSQHYGKLPRMRTLPDVPLQKVTPAEAEAYRLYVENYSNYWRRFFDPIGIRLDEVGTDQLELSTFILPLVDNSIYNGLRQVIAHQDDLTTLSVPVVEPAPVLQFSMNLNDQAWRQVAGNFSEFFTRYSGASSAMLDDFGPSAHIAIFDADPIVAWGSGDIFDAFSGQVLRGGGNDMLALPVVLSMLTRPCSIMVETKSPERTKQYLRQAALASTGMNPSRGGFFNVNVSFYQVENSESWVWTMEIVGMVNLRYGVEVAGKYLVIRNIPWSSEDRVVSVVPAELNGAMLQANPGACQQQLPGLFAAAADANRRAAMSGLGRLYPFMLCGAESVSDAATQHQRLYGFHPKPIGKDHWSWSDYQMISEHYGQPTRQRQPAYDPDEPFGLMNRIDSLQLNMQFEDDGLRSSIRWRLR